MKTIQPYVWLIGKKWLIYYAAASKDQVHNFIKTYTTYFPHRKSHLQMCVAQMVRREKFGFQKFWLRVGISSQLASLEKLEWRKKLKVY